MADDVATAPAIGHNSKGLWSVLEEDPNLIFHQPGMLAELVAEIETEIDSHEPDLETEKGRKATASFARSIVTKKTRLDAAGKELNREAREKIAVVDGVRRGIRDELDKLKDKARLPLSRWEAEEAKRESSRRAIIDQLETGDSLPVGAKSSLIAERLEQISAVNIDDKLFGMVPGAHLRRQQQKTVETLRRALAAQSKAEADAAELARLREAEAQRQATEAARIEAEAAAKARAEREAQVAAEAAEQAARQAREAAEKEAAVKAAAHQTELDKERRKREAAEVKAAEEQAARDTAESERQQREADEAHRQQITAAITWAFIEQIGFAPDVAPRITEALTSGQIPNVTVNY